MIVSARNLKYLIIKATEMAFCYLRKRVHIQKQHEIQDRIHNFHWGGGGGQKIM